MDRSPVSLLFFTEKNCNVLLTFLKLFSLLLHLYGSQVSYSLLVLLQNSFSYTLTFIYPTTQFLIRMALNAWIDFKRINMLTINVFKPS